MNTKEFKYKVLSLSDRIYPMVVRMLGNRENALDAIQDIMIKLWERRKQLGNHPNIDAFVFLTARNHCLDLLKKKKHQQIEFDIKLLDVEQETGQSQMEWKELNELVESIIRKLPEQQRKVIILRDIDGYEINEISLVTQLKVEHIRVLLSRARKRIGFELNKFYSNEQRKNR